MDDILVSVICTAFNHSKYIQKTLEGFVKQKTNFKFEILINDDASKDNTAEIIRIYEQKYPEIIKATYQKENQYSKGVKILKTFLLPQAKGKYIALCEGDDCWISENKLQMQVDYMENHSNCTFCFTNAIVNDLKNKKHKLFMKRFNKKNFNEPLDFDLAELNSLKFIPTCTFLFPKKNYELFPESYNEYCFGGDRKLSLFSTALGYAHYMPIITGQYNFGVENSALTRKKSINEQLKILDSFINLSNNLDNFTNYKFNSSFIKYVEKIQINKLYIDFDNLIQQQEYEKIYKKMPMKLKVKLFIKKRMPFVIRLLKK